MSEMTKPNCYKCIYLGDVPGSVHSSCKHPALSEAHNDPFMQAMGIFASVRRVPPVNVQATTEKLTVKGNAHGISRGWFNHPWNFDPFWLEECSGFKAKDQS